MQNKIAPVWNTTHWSMVYASGRPEQDSGYEALGRVLALYRLPCVMHLANRFSVSMETAEDWVHAFIEKKVLAQDLLAQADASKGRFRDFLRVSLNRFAIDQMRKDARMVVVENPLDEVSRNDPFDESWVDPEPGPFTDAWVKTLLREAMERLEKHYTLRGVPHHWDLCYEGLIAPKLNDTDLPPRRDLTVKFGFESEAKTNNTILNVKRLFRQMVLALVSEYCHRDESIEEEWNALKRHLYRRAPMQKQSA